MKQLLLLTVLVITAISLIASDIIVSSTDDSGPGSLREAINQANSSAGQDHILFNIPTGDSKYDGTVWSIQLSSQLPELTDNETIIDGLSQELNQGNKNPNGPEIMLDGNATTSADGLVIKSSRNEIHHLIISKFSKSGIYIVTSSAQENMIHDCYIGTDATGTQAYGNTDYGIFIAGGAKLNQIVHSVISGNQSTGIALNGKGTDENRIFGNIIGLNAAGDAAIPNYNHGIQIQNFASHNQVGGPSADERNTVSGNGWSGLATSGDSTGFNSFINNFSGTDITGNFAIGNKYHGIHTGGIKNTFFQNLVSGNDQNGMVVSGTSSQILAFENRIGLAGDSVDPLPNKKTGVYIYGSSENDTLRDNKIWYNQSYGIKLEGTTVEHVTITHNSIASNDSGGIKLYNGANEGILPPVINSISPVSGTAQPESMIEIYSDDTNQGKVFEGDTPVDEHGNWSFPNPVSGPHVTTTTRDKNGNTSEFSSAMATDIDRHKINSKPATFRLEQNHPNPFNPNTAIKFTIQQSGFIKLAVYNLQGHHVRTLINEYRPAGSYISHFEAPDLPSGIYVYQIQAGNQSERKKMLLIK